MPSPFFRAFVVATLAAAALTASSALAQVQVHLQTAKQQYVAHERVMVTVTITNRAGRNLLLQGQGSQNWLNFEVWDSKGRRLTTRRGKALFRAAEVPAGQSVSKTLDLNALYPLSELGRYRVRAVVKLNEGAGALFGSNTAGFNVTNARTIYSQRVGVPGSKNVREYRVLSFSGQQKTVLYVQVKDMNSGRMLQTQPLGEALMFRKPTATVDGNNNLHLLYLVNPTTFARIRVSPEGKVLGQDLHKRGATGAPRLVTFANGEVQVAGGVPYDPAARQRTQSKIRRLTERPAVLFR